MISHAISKAACNHELFKWKGPLHPRGEFSSLDIFKQSLGTFPRESNLGGCCIGMERVGVVRIIIEHLLCSQLDIISFNPLPPKTHEVDILTPLLRIQQVQRFIELVHTQLGRDAARVQTSSVGAKPALSDPRFICLLQRLRRTTPSFKFSCALVGSEPDVPDLRTHGLPPAALAETAICLLDSSLRIQSSLREPVVRKQLFSRQISLGSNLFCQAALAPSYLQIGLTAGTPHPRDG